MSTRSILAFETEKGVRGVYIHSDGYPEGKHGRLSQLKILLERDGVTKLATTVLAHPYWSCLFADTTENSTNLNDNTFVSGYGQVFEPEPGDRYFTPDQLAEWWDSEYVYLVNPEGKVRWATLGVRIPGGYTGDKGWDSLQWREDVPSEDAS